MSINETQGAGGSAWRVYRVVVGPLAPGEYAPVTRVGVFYDFGVNAGRQ